MDEGVKLVGDNHNNNNDIINKIKEDKTSKK